MTKPPRPLHEVEEVKETILENALGIIIDEGYTHMTMRKIASKSDMSATNIYNYFSNKDEIYLLLVIKGFDKLRQKFDVICEEKHRPWSQGSRLIRAYLDFGIENRHYYEIMFTRPTPKFNDYKDTPLEKLAMVELKHSMKIAHVVAETIGAILEIDDLESPVIKNKVMQLWSLVHGMVSLFHSNIAEYVIDDREELFASLEKDLIINLSPEAYKEQLTKK